MTKKTVEYKAPTADKLFKTVGEVDKALASIKLRGVKLQNDVHLAACSLLKHLFENKDIRMVHRLMDALPASYRTNAMRDWLTAFGPVSWDKNKAVFNTKFDLSEADKHVRDALLNPFWLFTEEPAYVPVDVAAMLNAVIKKLDKDMVQSGGKVDHKALMSALETLKPEPAKKPASGVDGPGAPAASDPMATAPELHG